MLNDTNNNIELYKTESLLLLENYDRFLAILQKIPSEKLAESLTEADVSNLERLITIGVNPYYLFEVLLCFDKNIAENYLESKFTGIYVCPDRKGNGYESVLSTMLEDYYEHFGKRELKKFLLSDRVSYRRLMDPRLIRSIADIFEEKEDNIVKWIQENKEVSEQDRVYMQTIPNAWGEPNYRTEL